MINFFSSAIRRVVDAVLKRQTSLLIDGEWVDIGIRVHRGRPFKSKPRDAERLSEVQAHESVSYSLASAERTLRRKGLGVAVAIDEKGRVWQFNEVARDRTVHAAGHNGVSVGLEIINIYYGHLLRPRDPWSIVIDAGWAHKKRYVVPLQAQLEAAWAVVQAVAEETNVTLEWPGIDERGRLAMSRLPDGDRRRPGIWAHYYSSTHSDGAFPVLYFYLRAHGRDADAAYAEAIDLAATPKRWVQVT